MRGHDPRWRHRERWHEHMERCHPHMRHPWHQRGPMGRLGWYVRARLHRRLFLWFGMSILSTGIVVATVMSLVGGNTWRQEMERGHTFLSHRFAEVWDEPAQREARLRAYAGDLQVDAELLDASGQLVARAGEMCSHPEFSVPVEREGVRLGTVRACLGRNRPRSPWHMALPLLLSGAMLWLISGRIARRLSRPMNELVFAAEQLGQGKLDARVTLGRQASGEFSVLAAAFNIMAERIEKQLADQRELLAAVSHELRTPLARLRVLTEILRDGGGDARTLDNVDREVLELDALVGELLASSRLDFGQVTPRALDGLELAARALERAGLPTEALSVETANTALLADTTLLGRALANLFDNARRHGGGAKTLRLFERNGQLAFCVEDAGPGLQPGEETRIFAPFYRKDRGGEAREAGSLGLGLALVQRIAKAHGGEAFAENRPEGGARVGFTVRREGPPETAGLPRA